MCFGDGGAAARQEAEDRARNQARAYESALLAAEQRNAETLATIKPKYTPPPVDSGAAMQDTQGVQKKKSRKSSIIDANKGVASLRIPLNTGGVGSSGPNLG